MKRKILQLSIIIFFVISSINTIQAQVFTGFKAFKELIEYEGQRYLMENIYQIKTENYDKLKISKTIKEVDNDEGFMFVLTSYTFNGSSGVVITSFNSTNFSSKQQKFVNINLTHDQYIELYNTFNELEKIQTQNNEHILRKFNDRLIVDVNNEEGIIYYTLWIDNNRHTFTRQKWDRAIKKYKEFIEP